jgi:hypothetical protein
VKQMSGRGLTIAFSTARSPAQIRRYCQHLRLTVGVHPLQILIARNPGREALGTVYNRFLARARYEVVCLIHDDLIFRRNRGWGRQVLQAFARFQDFAVLGAAGSATLDQQAFPWGQRADMLGRIHQKNPLNDRIEAHYFSGASGSDPLESLFLDGLLLAVHRQRCRIRFHPSLRGFHGYDLQFCLELERQQQQGQAHCKRGVLTELGVTHLSAGRFDAAFEQARAQIQHRYSDLLPLTQFPTRTEAFPGLPAPRTPRLAVILIHLHPELTLEPCWQALADHPEALLIYASPFASPRPELSGRRHCCYLLSQTNLAAAVVEIARAFTLDGFEGILIWDSRVIPPPGTFAYLKRRLVNTPLPIGTLGLRLHYPDRRVYFAGLQLLRAAHGQVHCAFAGIHSLYNHPFHTVPVAANHLSFSLITPALIPVLQQLHQEWIPGLELNLHALTLGRFNFLLGEAGGVYREVESEHTLSRRWRAWHLQQFEQLFQEWLTQTGQSAAIQAWIRPLGGWK